LVPRPQAGENLHPGHAKSETSSIISFHVNYKMDVGLRPDPNMLSLTKKYQDIKWRCAF